MLFRSVDGQIMGQTMFYDQMEDAWHFSESFLDALLGMVHPATRAVKSKTAAGAVSADTEGKYHVTGMKYDFSARMLPPLTEKQLSKIRARQLAAEGLIEEEPMVI